MLSSSEQEAVLEMDLQQALLDIRSPERPYSPDFLTLDQAREVVQLLNDTSNSMKSCVIEHSEVW